MFKPLPDRQIQDTYALAKKSYATLDVDTEAALEKTLQIPISLHCWQADDVCGFEVKPGVTDSGGIMATGNYPGRARTGDELRQDIEQALQLLPGTHRLNIHASYAETNGKAVDRDALEPQHFARFMDWARTQKIALDFNPTFFAHPKASEGYTLSHRDLKIRQFWIRHGIACRRIAQSMAEAQGSPCVINHWIPDGAKDQPADRWGPRARLVESLDGMLAPNLGVDTRLCIDALEGKLFGIGSEDYTVGSNEFYGQYALKKNCVLCLDMGHFHPTETVADKLSALMQFHPRLLLHVSRGIRWDSDHVVNFNDDLRQVFHELVSGNALDRVFIALDYFDASINRIGAYVIGARATRKAALNALLTPHATLKELEATGRNAQKLALLEELRTQPLGAVWDELCRRAKVPAGLAWIDEIEKYENDVLRKRT
jgi:L-rhamnose isomerase